LLLLLLLLTCALPRADKQHDNVDYKAAEQRDRNKKKNNNNDGGGLK